MKKFITAVVAVILMATAPQTANAQKIAHFDLDSLLEIMPAFQKASDSAAAYYKMLENQLVVMQMEYERKLNEYDSLNKTWSTLIKQLKEKEIYDLQQNIQAFQASAQQDFANKQKQLVEPIYNDINKAVKEIAKEKGYKYVLDSSKAAGVVLYADPTDDIFELLRVKLNIPKPAPKTTPAPGK
ncbi:MAG: hypothetical protein Fur0041_11990 [Bacteroidia bacterium]